jgi:hypothetical protein
VTILKVRGSSLLMGLGFAWPRLFRAFRFGKP